VKWRGPGWLHAVPRPIRSGHRGAAGLLPANTLVSYAEAVRLGCDLVEMDVQPTADGTLVLRHDNDVLVDGVRRPVGSMTLAELRGMVPATPTLDEALTLLRGRAIPLLDLKGTGFEAQLGAAVREAGLRQAVVCGRPLESIIATNRANPAIATSLTFEGRDLEAFDEAQIRALPTDAVTVNYRPLTAAIIDRFHNEGITVFAWTVDDPSVMRALVANGVDGITTNRPDLLIAQFPR
jgi:glycerophosphoryl diester phosphodiesterase